VAVARTSIDSRLAPILDKVARAVAGHGIKSGDASGAKGRLRVELEEHVSRVVQVYWTPFQATIPGQSIGLHLEVAEPRVHWAEAYLSPVSRNWVFVFHERDDGDIQLTRYGDYATPDETLEQFFMLSGWHVLTATDLTWKDVVHEPSPGVGWTTHQSDILRSNVDAAISEALKKGTIVWLRWRNSQGLEQTMPVWFVLDQGKLYVLSGERQQTIPGARDLRSADVIVRWKGKQARVAEIPSTIRVLPKGTPEWDTIAEKIAEKRLNIPGLPEETARRWRDECEILELTLVSV
jgi:hypothetical protein